MDRTRYIQTTIGFLELIFSNEKLKVINFLDKEILPDISKQ
jgi:hypothetical protein